MPFGAKHPNLEDQAGGVDRLMRVNCYPGQWIRAYACLARIEGSDRCA